MIGGVLQSVPDLCQLCRRCFPATTVIRIRRLGAATLPLVDVFAIGDGDPQTWQAVIDRIEPSWLVGTVDASDDGSAAEIRLTKRRSD